MSGNQIIMVAILVNPLKQCVRIGSEKLVDSRDNDVSSTVGILLVTLRLFLFYQPDR